MAESTALLLIAGWLIVLALIALGASLPAMPGRGHAGWLLGFGATRLLVETQPVVFPSLNQEWRQLALMLGATLLWEFARQTWNDFRGRHVPAATHLVALECVGLTVATNGLAGGARPPWVLSIDLFFGTLPFLLGAVAALLLWTSVPRTGPRLALVGFGLAGIAPSAPAVGWLGIVAPWLAALGLGLTCLPEPATRTRHALACASGFFVSIILGPLLLAGHLRQLEADGRAEILERAERAARPLQGRIAARLSEVPASAETRRTIVRHLENLRASDPLLHGLQLWQVRGDRLWSFDASRATAGFFDLRGAHPIELTPPLGTRPFVTEEINGLVGAHAPLTADLFESPVAWLGLEYPARFWAVQRQHARRTGTALIGVIAVFCAMGFVLAGRQAIERAQQLKVERVQAADRAKNEFLALLSHEMRTPLQTIVGRADLLRRESAAAERHASAIETQGQHLLRLVNDLLDLGTIEAGKLKLQPAPFNLPRLLASLEETHGPVAALKGLALDLVVAPGIPESLLGDEARLRQILGNLLGNAVKYTARGQITLTVQTGGRELAAGDSPTGSRLPSPDSCPLIFTVADTGPGLPPEKFPQLFTLFTRLDSGATFTREGTGVGLALVRRLCDLMGGTVTAANRTEGGSEFTVRLSFPFAPAPAPGGSPAKDNAIRPLRVLVAEDNDPAREFLVEALGSLGHEVASATDGHAALALCQAGRFDAVVLDVNLPGRDGIAIARVLAAQLPRPRLVGCSAEVFAGTRTAALAAGMDAYLEKPVTVAALAFALALSTTPSSDPSLFERLRSPALTAQTRVALARDLPIVLEQLRQAHNADESTLVRRHAHLLRSTALFADEAHLAELCRRLEHAAAAGDDTAVVAILDELMHHTEARAS